MQRKEHRTYSNVKSTHFHLKKKKKRNDVQELLVMQLKSFYNSCKENQLVRVQKKTAVENNPHRQFRHIGKTKKRSFIIFC